MRDGVAEDYRNSDQLGLFIVHSYQSTRLYSIFATIENAAADAEVSSQTYGSAAMYFNH